MDQSKRILITSVNGVLGHCMFEQFRNDYIHINSENKKPHRFLGTLNSTSVFTRSTLCPSESIKIIDFKQKPKTF